MRTIEAVAAVILLTLPALAGNHARTDPPEPGPWEFLSTSAIGARAFLEAHPEWDGRGVVIAVLDTGVEAELAGLRETTTGEPKLIDLRDFSGQGDVELERAIRDEDEHGEGLHDGAGRWLRGLAAVAPDARDASLRIGYLDEAKLPGSAARDLDGNGRVDDVYGVVVYATDAHRDNARRIVVDTDSDGRLDDEEVRADFLEQPRTFTLGAADRREGASGLSLALNLWEDDPDTVTFVFDDGAHGTHVAGIAAGHRIGGQQGQNGIAPGARIISLKLGDNALSGGATTSGSMWRSWNYAAEFARERDVPLIVQMSYGVGSELEGQAAMEAEIDRILEEHETLTGFVSCGNSGPGISSAGLPANARRVIAAGAVLNRETARDVYGNDLPTHNMFYFSSRGAETAKPDLAAPGFAASTVPAWREGSDVMRGTSMASPQGAGAAALIASAALAEGLPVVGGWIRAALRRGARPIDGATALDQGAGLIDVPRAWEVYAALASRSDTEPVEWFVDTESPELAPSTGPAAHWRGIPPPEPPEVQPVTITPQFRRAVTAVERQEFYRAFDLVATADWFRPDRSSVYTRSGRPIEFGLVYDTRELREPGLYTGRLLAFDKSLSRAERQRLGPDWDLPVSVVVAHEPALGRDWRAPELRLAAAAIERDYLRVPLGASGMQVRAELPAGSRQEARAFLFDPEGRRFSLPEVGGAHGRETLLRVPADALVPGVWEIVRYAHYGNSEPVPLDVEVRFDGLAVAGGKLSLVAHEGAPPEGTLELTNRSQATFRGTVEARVTGYRIISEEELGSEKLKLELPLGPDVDRVDLLATMSPSSWNRFTDVAIRLLDGDGETLVSDGMLYAKARVGLANPAPGAAASYDLEVIGAVADPDDGDTTAFRIERTYRYAEAIPIEVTQGEAATATLYPDRPAELTLACERTPPALPEGAAWIVELELTDEAHRERTTRSEVVARPNR